MLVYLGLRTRKDSVDNDHLCPSIILKVHLGGSSQHRYERVFFIIQFIPNHREPN